MTQEFHAPPVGTVFEDTPYGHALIERYKPWIMAHCGDEPFILSSDGRPLYPRVFEKRKYLPWTVQCTDSAFAADFTQDTKLPMPVPPIGTQFNCYADLEAKYPEFIELLRNADSIFRYLKCYPEYMLNPTNSSLKWVEVIAHPKHSVVVSFVDLEN